jgi:hypothetical protein
MMLIFQNLLGRACQLSAYEIDHVAGGGWFVSMGMMHPAQPH